MEKEKYEKPEFEIINLLNEVFTEDSQNPEGTDDDPFKDDEEMDTLTMLQQVGEKLDGFLEEDEVVEKIDDDSNEENNNPLEELEDSEEQATPTDESVLDEIQDAFSDITEDINNAVEGGNSSDYDNLTENESNDNLDQDGF